MNEMKEGQRVKVAHLDELPIQIGKEVIIDNHHIALFRLTSGNVKAIENKCPHKQGPLAQGIVSGEHVFCPLHDWKIDVTTGEVQKPDDGCVKTYPVEVVDNIVFIVI
ncbi:MULTISPECIES: nitrite reductase small subunit NirD [Bacillaceae]|uniref:Nitrite reductase small subunit NirD n=1 Tax=Evansella alkalicola TaxID=745819 RepID=A0ABS6JVI9_9BACI|nr:MULTISPECIES: nitrite reductase small subunit NirD [Bacillaceae]MBU9722571.1 nitrite reductase small subunit NirD [Bacillus alkalicola]